MSLDIEKVAKLVGFVDRLIQIKEAENQLDEKTIDEMIKQALLISGATYSKEELDAAKRDITWKYQIFTTPGQSILADYDEADWYEDAKSEITPVFWTRYKDYLIDKKHFSPSVVSTLGDDTLDQKLMKYVLNPKATYPTPVLKRGLIIGDVQSGKTSTYMQKRLNVRQTILNPEEKSGRIIRRSFYRTALSIRQLTLYGPLLPNKTGTRTPVICTLTAV